MRDDEKDVEQTRARWSRENKKKRKDRYGDRWKAWEIAASEIRARGGGGEGA